MRIRFVWKGILVAVYVAIAVHKMVLDIVCNAAQGAVGSHIDVAQRQISAQLLGLKRRNSCGLARQRCRQVGTDAREGDLWELIISIQTRSSPLCELPRG
jgi:hypothetical protein